MSVKLSEAARLYLNDYDILNEARREVVSLFDEVWATCKQTVISSMKESSELNGRKLASMIDVRTPNNGRPAKWSIGFGSSAWAVAHDPDSVTQRFREPRQFVVGIEVSKTWAQKMKFGLNCGQGRKEVNRIANERGFEVNWESLGWFVEEPAIEIDIDNPGETGRLVAQALIKMLGHINAMVPAENGNGADEVEDAAIAEEVSENI